MQNAVIIGSPLRFSAGQAGQITGLIINPNRSHLDYLITQSDPRGERDFYVPSGLIQQIGDQGVAVRLGANELGDLPHPQDHVDQGTIQDNLADLCIVQDRTRVLTIDGDMLGNLHGVLVDTDLQIHALLLGQSPDTAVPIQGISKHAAGGDAIAVELAGTDMHQAKALG
jgi:sporulation protein YlmC with PRC-barrel domain